MMDLKRHAEESQGEPVSGNVAFQVVRHDPTKLSALVFTEYIFQDDDGAQSIVIFGTTGSGKSSLINILLESEEAPASNDAIGCTATNDDYLFSIDERKYRIWDTPGLNEGSEGLVPAEVALKNLKSFVKERMRDKNHTSIFILCIEGSLDVKAQLRHYDSLKSTIRGAPFSIVVTGMDRCSSSPWSKWWGEHQKVLQSFGVASVDHACVCTLMDGDEPAGSRQEVVDLIRRATLHLSSKHMPARIQRDDGETYGRRDTDPLISRQPSSSLSEGGFEQTFFDYKGCLTWNRLWTRRRIGVHSIAVPQVKILCNELHCPSNLCLPCRPHHLGFRFRILP